MIRSMPVLAAAAALLFGAPCLAANVVVTANANLTFTPATVTIHAGDSVTFKNVGGGYHNVVADDGSFRCAVSCDDTSGSGGGGGGGGYLTGGSGGNPSSSNWQFTLTFNTPGSIGYHCEVHGGPGVGMYGTIIVQKAFAPGPTLLGGYLSGAWYDPATSGQGFDLEFTDQADTLVAYWYTYALDGSGPIWIYAQGTYDPTMSTVTIPAIIQGGTAFLPNFNKADVHHTPWGTLTFSFTSCDAGTVSWDATLAGYGDGNLPLTRLTRIAGTQCPETTSP